MRIYTTLETFRPDFSSPLFLALGNFDGLHIGHQNILRRALQEAALSKGRLAVLTFQRHPQQILQTQKPVPRLLTSPFHKLWLLKESKADICFFLPFTTEFSRLEPEAFIEKILIQRLKIHKVYMGYSARFGHHRKGDVNLMREASKRFGFGFEEIPPVKIQNEFVSSSKIREFVSAGRLEEARSFLGRPYSILGKVIKGGGQGARLGYPTANLEAVEYVLPPQGVYPAEARLFSLSAGPQNEAGEIFRGGPAGSWYRGVLNYGFRPTFKAAAEPQLEIHLLDFHGDLYGKDLEVSFHPRFREEKRFETAEGLKAQIAEDIAAAKRYFSISQVSPLQKTAKESGGAFLFLK